MMETLAIVCGHVFRDERPVKVAIHHSDGTWQLVCGARDHPEDFSDFETVGFEHVYERQKELTRLLSLKRGSIAEKGDDGNWATSPFAE